MSKDNNNTPTTPQPAPNGMGMFGDMSMLRDIIKVRKSSNTPKNLPIHIVPPHADLLMKLSNLPARARNLFAHYRFCKTNAIPIRRKNTATFRFKSDAIIKMILI